MDIYWEYSGCDLDEERRIEHCWERIQSELEANLESLPDPPTELRMAVDHEDEPPEWRINAAMHMPGRTLAVEATANDIDTAFDGLLTRLSGEVDSLADQPVRATQRISGLEGILPFLENSHRLGRRDVFMSYLTPIVGSLAAYIQRELQLREMEGAPAAEQVTTPDILDEVLLQAWQQYDERPGELPLDMWLIQLADPLLDNAETGRATNSLEDELPVPSNEAAGSQRDYWQEQVTYPETIELHEMLPGKQDGDAWDEVDWDSKHTDLAQLLVGLPRQQRQTLLLCAVQGFSEAEVADFQNRPQDQVTRDIETAKKTLARQLRRN